VVVLKSGKLSTDMLRKGIIDRIRLKRPEVLVHSDIGRDCSIIQYDTECCVLSSDPITGSDSHMGYLAVHINCNDIAASGVEPIGIMVTILAPEGSSEQQIFDVMDEINSTAESLNVEVLGGHTEVTDAVNKMVVSVTAVGKGTANGYITTSGAHDGDSIIVTKSVGLEGMSIIARKYEHYLRKILSGGIVENAKKFIDMISVSREGIIGGRMGATCMHDATEGGLLGALWEIAESSRKGFEIRRELIPIAHETSVICGKLGIDPLRLISSGMMVMTTNNRDSLLEALYNEGIPAACIGNVLENASRRVMISEGREEVIEPPAADELFNVKLNI
jgi:hydrogenase expression/formation protein HypE